jgi:hypothetical protein
MTNQNGMNRIVRDAQNLISDIRLGLGDTFTFADLLAHTEKSVRAEIIHLRLPLIGSLNAFCYYDGDINKFVTRPYLARTCRQKTSAYNRQDYRSLRKRGRFRLNWGNSLLCPRKPSARARNISRNRSRAT